MPDAAHSQRNPGPNRQDIKVVAGNRGTEK